MSKILAPISLGELVDKISILEIKLQEVKSSEQRHNIRNEYDQLLDIFRSNAHYGDRHLENFCLELLEVNRNLWDLEDQIRQVMDNERFDGDAFCIIGKKIHNTNDRRASIKKQINEQYGSDIVEEKIFSGRSI